MRSLTKMLLGVLPAALVGISSADAASWKHDCQGPEVACSSTGPVVGAAKPSAKAAANATASAKKTMKSAAQKKPATAKKVAAKKKILANANDDVSDKQAKKKVAAKKKYVAKAQSQADQEKPVKKVAKKNKGDGGGSTYESGIASWYGGNFHGRKTANGETYDMWAMTAAHKYLPFGTRVKVTNLGNGDSTIVRINDRGPFIGGRVIDLSRAAANDIGMGGLAKVKLTILGKG